MASHQDFVDYVVEQLREAGAIRSRKMFGEYGLYCDDVFFAVICDDQFFVKVTPQGEAAFPDLPKAPPYEGAKDSFLVEDVENRKLMTELTRITCEALKSKPQKTGRK
ncbi:MAG: TfoX/Sxy family protein [Flintibacter sp.]|uniref:TfoX/Sxy family protein n=1 Tax=unclassified Flintibacter TaxID=2610894 RepID=UPI0012441DDF|nr:MULTISPECIES: TfoX/Sxy family protein [unclassified Flintibacter]MCI6151283.1 TfoX/Sxy family protein [Flintibacter sp.]MDY5038045.1 TfoX/Sxy family protein [Lawsonibacter sp.]